MRKLLFLFTAIGAAYYFFEPKGGARRRQAALDRASSSLGQGSQAGSQFAQTVTSQAQNMTSQAQSAVQSRVSRQPDNPAPDDNTLRDRVETELFRDPNIPKGDLNIFVVDGIVDLRGELASQDLIDTVVQRAQSIEHVKGVRSYLHLPDTPAPNKEEAIEASE